MCMYHLSVRPPDKRNPGLELQGVPWLLVDIDREPEVDHVQTG